MKRIVIDDTNRAYMADFKNEEVSFIEGTGIYYWIDKFIICPEDCEIKYKQKGHTCIKKAEKNDVIVVFDTRRDWIEEKVAVIKNADFKKNVIAKQAMEAAKKAKDEIYAQAESPCRGWDFCV